MIWELEGRNGASQLYAVFFDAEKEKTRKRRVIIRIQSAYILDQGVTRRQKEAKKVGWETLLRAAYAYNHWRNNKARKICILRALLHPALPADIGSGK